MKTIPFDTIDLAGLVVTTRDARVLCDEIKHLAIVLDEGVSLHAGITKVFPYERVPTVQTLLKKYQISETDMLQIKSFFQQIFTAIEQLPSISLTIAISPTTALLQVISSWVALNLKTFMLLDISVDKSLGGGAIIEYRGNFKDYSLRKKLRILSEQGGISGKRL